MAFTACHVAIPPKRNEGYEENDHSAVHHSPGTCPGHVVPAGRSHEALRQQKSRDVQGRKEPATRTATDKHHVTDTRQSDLLGQACTPSTRSEAQKGPLTWENVPKVGLEPHSSLCKHWEVQKT